jgi:hypothetical protein
MKVEGKNENTSYNGGKPISFLQSSFLYITSQLAIHIPFVSTTIELNSKTKRSMIAHSPFISIGRGKV